MNRPLLAGLVAGAAGTAALNVITYLDMTVRGRPASEMPAKAAGELAGDSHLPLGDEPAGGNRREGLAALLGYATGLGVGAGYGLLRQRVRVPVPIAAVLLGGAAMIGSDAPMTALGLTDPRTWPASSWAADLVPHAAYGLAAAGAYALYDR